MSEATGTATGATGTAYSIDASTIAAAELAIGSAWKNCQRPNLEFGKVCRQWRDSLKSQGVKGEGLRQILTKLNINHGVAYYWIEKYEISIGVKTAKPAKAAPEKERPAVELGPESKKAAARVNEVLEQHRKQVESEQEPVFTTETPEDFSTLPDPATVRPDPIPDPISEPTPIPASVPAVQEDSDTKMLQKRFPKCTGITVKASTVKDGLKSCQNRWNLIGLTKRQVEEYATYLLAKRNP